MTGFLYGHQGKRRKLKRAAGRIFRKMREIVIYALLVLIGLFLCSPVLLLLSGSITGDYELTQALKPALLEGSGFISWDFIPEFPTFASFRFFLPNMHERYAYVLEVMAIFYAFLELNKNGASDSGRTAFGFGSGSLGLCSI